ncbi:MAG: alpha/beta hydrolase [Clostridiales bacterium]|jgi:acetyl esterase/lipase|nr:alpha/beta hydrolase [Clostridiales bacterium]
MTAKTVFKIIDLSMDPIQNNGYKTFVRKKHISVIHDIVYDDAYPDIRKGDLYFKSPNDADESAISADSAKINGSNGGAISVNASKSNGSNGDTISVNAQKTPPKKPLLINVHGGGFVAGEKKYRRYFSAYVAAAGYAVFNINYGVGPENKFPFCLESVAKAMTWAEKNAEKYNFDTSKIVLSGDSAGAALAALGALTAEKEGFANSLGIERPNVKAAGVLLYCGPYDIQTAMEAKVPFDLVNKMMTDITGYDINHINDFKYIRQFSPMDFVDENYPKAFLVYAKKDIFCKNHGEIFEKTLAEKGVEVSSFHSTKLFDNHCFHLNHNFKMAKEAMKKSEEFLKSI